MDEQVPSSPQGEIIHQNGATQTQHAVFDDVQIGIGTWAWGDRLYWNYGHGYSEKDLKDAFYWLIKSGIHFFDTAEVYGQGSSERMLGSFLAESGQPIKIATKFMPLPWRLSRKALLRALRKSLRRLGVASVDLYQIHMPLPPVTVETWMAAMAEAFQDGLIQAVGVSNYDREQMQRAYDALLGEGIKLASNQVEYHLLNRKAEKSGLLKQSQDLGVRLIAYSPLASGMLSGKYTPENPPEGIRANRYNRAMLGKVQPLIRMLQKIGGEHEGKTPAQVALNWVICKGFIPIPGVKNLEQAQMNIDVLDWRLSEAEVSRLDDASDAVIESIEKRDSSTGLSV
jgi:aryl-alcohol dehydrogenase-like predicted oxidoreductase